MRTPTDIKTTFVDYMQTTVPARCVVHDTAPPAKYFPHGFRELGPDEWPAVFVEEQDRNHQLLEHDDDGNPIFLINWQFSVELWVRVLDSKDWAAAEDHRGRLELAVVEAALDKPGLTAAGLALDETSLLSDYSPLFVTKQGQPACAVELRLTIQTAELLDRAVLGTAPTGLTVEVIPLEDD